MRVSDTAIGLSLIIFACAVLLHVQSFPELDNGYPGPALFPSVLAVLFILCGIGLIIQGILKREKVLRFDTGSVSLAGWINIAFVLGAIVCYIFLSGYIGFLIFSFVILMILMKWLKVKTLLSVAMSVGVTLAIYLLFAKVLLVPLPWGLWGW
jgi:putative tricarboxylic transport membrane protein